MKKINTLFAGLTFIFVTLMLTSCTLEKRHYCNGYYVQRNSGTFRQHEHAMQTARVPSNVTLIDTAETAKFKNASENDGCIPTLEKITKDSSAVKSQRHSIANELNNSDGDILTSAQPEKNGSQPNLDDEPVEKKPKQRTGNLFIIAGAVLLIAVVFLFNVVLLGLGIIFLIIGLVLSIRQRKRTITEPNLDDKPVEKKGKQKSGNGFIIAGIILMVLGFVVLPLLVLGLLSFIEGMLIRIKVRREKGRLINTKPLWISALILLGISLVFIVLAASNVELLIFGGLISLPIALILTIVASRIDRGNRKAQQNQSNSQPPKERFRKLKKVLKWVAIGLTAMLLALIIGFISNL